MERCFSEERPHVTSKGTADVQKCSLLPGNLCLLFPDVGLNSENVLICCFCCFLLHWWYFVPVLQLLIFIICKRRQRVGRVYVIFPVNVWPSNLVWLNNFRKDERKKNPTICQSVKSFPPILSLIFSPSYLLSPLVVLLFRETNQQTRKSICKY